MNLILQLVAKNLRHFRWPALFFAGLTMAQIGFTNWMLSASAADVNWYQAMAGFTNLLYVLGIVVSYLLAGMLVLADSPAGSVAHWKTRPISGPRLLAAKLISGILILGVPPVLLWLPWWLYCGFSSAGLLQAIATVLMASLLPAVVGAALAALVDQVGRFVLLTMIFVAVLIAFAIDTIARSGTLPSLSGTRVLLGLVCFFTAALATTVTQYLTRHTGKSTALLVAGVVAVLLIRSWWPVDWVKQWNESHEALADSSGISGRVWHATEGTVKNKEGWDEPYILLSLGLSGVPEDLYVSGGWADVELSWPDGTKVNRERVRLHSIREATIGKARLHAFGLKPGQFQSPQDSDPETAAKNTELKLPFEKRKEFIRARGVAKQGKKLPGDLDFSLDCRVSVSPAIATKARLGPPMCRVTAVFETSRSVMLGESPVRRNAAIVRDGRMTTVKLERTTRREVQPPSLDVLYVGTITLAKPPMSRQRRIYLVDREHGEISPRLSSGQIFAVAPLAASVHSYNFDILAPSLWREDRWVEDPTWQKAFTLVEEESRPAGDFTYRFATDRLEIADPKTDE